MDFYLYGLSDRDSRRSRTGYRHWLLGAWLLLIFSSDGRAEEVNAPAEFHELAVFEQRIGLHFPGLWRLAHTESGEKRFSAEFIPQGQLLTDWHSLYCIQGVKALADDVNPETFLDSFASHYKHLCDGTMAYNKLGSDSVYGYESYSAILSCTKMPHTHGEERIEQGNKAEIGHYTVIDLKDDLLILHQSARGDALAPISSLSVSPPLQVISEIVSTR